MSVKVSNCPTCGSTDFTNLEDKKFVCNHCGNIITVKENSNAQVADLLQQGRIMLNALDFKIAKLYYLDAIKLDNACHEAYFGAFICDYGIEYVKESESRYVPTCHRASTLCVFDNFFLQQAINYSEGQEKQHYLDLASTYENIRCEIINKSAEIEPFDIFISYKSKDENGNFTRERDFCMELYFDLVKQNKKVFFADITLQKYAGLEYEPIIFKALNTAKIMFTVAFSLDNLNSIWVKNEWNRFLEIKNKSQDRRMVVVYKNFSPYDLPVELNTLQAIDVDRLTYLDTIRDIVKGINKDEFKRSEILEEEVKFNDVLPENVSRKSFIQKENKTIENLNNMQNALNFLESGAYPTAEKFFNLAIKEDRENGEAYFGLLMAMIRVKRVEDIPYNIQDLEDYSIFRLAIENSDELKGTEYMNIFSSALIEKINAKDVETSDKIFNEVISWIDEHQLKYLSMLMFNFSLSLVESSQPENALRIFKSSLKGLSQREINIYLDRHYAISKMLREKKAFKEAIYVNEQILKVSDKLARGKFEMYLAKNHLSSSFKIYNMLLNRRKFNKIKDIISKSFDEEIINQLVEAIIKCTSRTNYKKTGAIFDKIVVCIPTNYNELFVNVLFGYATKLMAISKFDLAAKYFIEITKVDPNFSRAYMGKIMCRYKVKDVNDLKKEKDNINKNIDYLSAINCKDRYADMYRKMGNK